MKIFSDFTDFKENYKCLPFLLTKLGWYNSDCAAWPTLRKALVVTCTKLSRVLVYLIFLSSFILSRCLWELKFWCGSKSHRNFTYVISTFLASKIGRKIGGGGREKRKMDEKEKREREKRSERVLKFSLVLREKFNLYMVVWSYLAFLFSLDLYSQNNTYFYLPVGTLWSSQFLRLQVVYRSFFLSFFFRLFFSSNH